MFVKIFVLFTFCFFGIVYTANNKVKNNQDDKCTLMQECRANICIYECIDDGILYDKYTMGYESIEKAYAAWLTLTDTTYLLNTLPKENTNDVYELTNIIYKWDKQESFQILLYEKNVLVGSLSIEKVNDKIIIKDKINFLQ